MSKKTSFQVKHEKTTANDVLFIIYIHGLLSRPSDKLQLRSECLQPS